MATKSTATDYTDFARRAFAPATRLNELMVGNVERIAKFQYELTGDLLQFGLDQLNASVKSRDLPALWTKQREIAAKFVEKAQAHQATLAELTAESHAGLALWFDDAMSFRNGKAA